MVVGKKGNSDISKSCQKARLAQVMIICKQSIDQNYDQRRHPFTLPVGSKIPTEGLIYDGEHGWWVKKKNVLSFLADTLIQSELQEQLGLGALLKGTAADFSPSLLRHSNQRPFGSWTNPRNR